MIDEKASILTSRFCLIIGYELVLLYVPITSLNYLLRLPSNYSGLLYLILNFLLLETALEWGFEYYRKRMENGSTKMKLAVLMMSLSTFLIFCSGFILWPLRWIDFLRVWFLFTGGLIASVLGFYLKSTSK